MIPRKSNLLSDRPVYLLHTFMVLFMLISPATLSLENDREQPIHIKAEAFKHDGKSRRTLYSGNVELVQGSIKLKADSISMLSTDKGELISIEAKGNRATFEQKPKPDKARIFGQAKVITYITDANAITLKGQAEIRQGEQMKMKSDIIEYLVDSEQVKANSLQPDNKTMDSRVNIVIPPRSELSKEGIK